MKLTRQRVIKNIQAFRALVDRSPKLGRTKINLVTMLDYCEALIPEGGIEYRRK